MLPSFLIRRYQLRRGVLGCGYAPYRYEAEFGLEVLFRGAF